MNRNKEETEKTSKPNDYLIAIDNLETVVLDNQKKIRVLDRQRYSSNTKQ